MGNSYKGVTLDANNRTTKRIEGNMLKNSIIFKMIKKDLHISIFPVLLHHQNNMRYGH